MTFRGVNGIKHRTINHTPFSIRCGFSFCDNHPFSPAAVVDIVLGGTPFKVIDSVVGLDFVDVVYLWEIIRVRDK